MRALIYIAGAVVGLIVGYAFGFGAFWITDEYVTHVSNDAAWGFGEVSAVLGLIAGIVIVRRTRRPSE